MQPQKTPLRTLCDPLILSGKISQAGEYGAAIRTHELLEKMQGLFPNLAVWRGRQSQKIGDKIIHSVGVMLTHVSLYLLWRVVSFEKDHRLLKL